MEELQKEKQEEIEKALEEFTMNKYEKIAEIKGSYEFMIKRLEQAKQKNPEKITKMKLQRDEEIKKAIEENEDLKKQKIE